MRRIAWTDKELLSIIEENSFEDVNTAAITSEMFREMAEYYRFNLEDPVAGEEGKMDINDSARDFLSDLFKENKIEATLFGRAILK